MPARTKPHAFAPPWYKIILLAAMTLPACGKTDTPAAAPTPGQNPAASQPNANAPVSDHLFKLADGADFATIQNQDMLHPQFELTPDDVDTPVIFAVVKNESTHTSAPVLLKKIATTWRIVELTEAPGQEWVYAAACTPRHEVWGLLDFSADPPAPQLLIVRSTDGGASWRYFSAVKKITPNAQYAGFSISVSGEGRLSLHLEDDVGPILHGYYHYKTRDGGKTWTGPTMEPDDVSEADSLAGFDTVKEAIKATESP